MIWADDPPARPCAGVFGGRWGGSGPLLESVNPATGAALGHVKSGTLAECAGAGSFDLA